VGGRPEITLEGANDVQGPWVEYHFKYKPGDVNSSLSFVGMYTLPEAWSGVNWADLMAGQGAFGTDFYDRSTRTIVGRMLWTEYRPVIKIGPKVQP